ncbi:MAG TPA: STT3 domain-containing protein [Alphaproteobacteria bacterium]|nr:STT3 domain-containing protein [Alphaproteobacteria bacterium]
MGVTERIILLVCGVFIISSDHNNSDSESVENLDFTKVKEFIKSKHFSTLLLVLLVLIPVILTMYIRLSPLELGQTDSWAESSVHNYYRNGIAQQVAAQYPNLPEANRAQLVEQQFQEFAKSNKETLEQQVAQTSEYFKTGFRYTENGNTYVFLGDLDSYFYLRQARNIAEKGMVCDEIRDGKCYDSYKFAPLGEEASPSMHPYGIFYLYKVLHFFNDKANLMHAAFILPTILAVIAAISAFFIGRRLMNTAAGFFASMFVTLSPMFITRSLGSDTDIWNIMFPLVVLWIVLEAIHTDKLNWKIGLTAFAGLVLGIFCWAWGGWWYIFDFIILTLIAYIGIVLLKNYLKHKNFKHMMNKDVKDTAIVLGVLFVSAFIFVVMFNSIHSFTNTINEPLARNTQLKAATNMDLWPNVLTTVAELNEAGLGTIIGQTAFGSAGLFTLALLGIIFTMVRREPRLKDYLLIIFSALLFLYLTSASGQALKPTTFLILLIATVAVAVFMYIFDKDEDHAGHHKIDIRAGLLFTLWFIAMIYASTKGVRFIMMLTPVFGIALGIAFGYIYQYLVRVFKDWMNMNLNLSKVIAFGLLCLILIMPLQVGIAAGKGYMPSMTTGWWDSLGKIREQSEPDAIINSWWDFGHWFKYVADRRVTLDGASQNHPNAHWLGKILQTNNERESVGILRMLDCGSNTAFELVNQKFQDTEISQNIVAKLVVMNKADSIELLEENGFTSTEIDEIMKNMYCDAPEDYFITSGDMVGKAGVWAHFGLWDFDRAFIINNILNEEKSLPEAIAIMKERWNYTEEEATRIYYDIQALSSDRAMNDWIAPWPGYAGGTFMPCTATPGNVVYCNVGLNLGNNGQANVVVERLAVNMSNPSKAQALLGFYDVNTGARVGESVGSWTKIVIADEDLKIYTPTNATINFGALIRVQHENNNTYYSLLLADQLLIDSTFTKLFYLDGKYSDKYFEKFSDVTDITGTRIIIWKVKWPTDAE